MSSKESPDNCPICDAEPSYMAYPYWLVSCTTAKCLLSIQNSAKWFPIDVWNKQKDLKS